MSAPSLKNKTFTTLGDFTNRALIDDYPTGQFERYKIKATSQKGAKYEYDAKVALEEKDKQVSAVVNDSFQIVFPFANRFFLQWGQRRNGDTRVHLDLGDVSLGGTKLNLFTNLKSNTSFSNFNFRFGFNYFGEKCESNSRFEHGTSAKDCKFFNFTQRTSIKSGNFVYAFVGTLDLLKIRPTLYNGIVGYQSKDLDLYLQHEVPSDAPKEGLKLGKVSANTTYRHKNETIYGSLTFQQKDKSKEDKTQVNDIELALGVAHKVNDNLTIKGKVDTRKNISLALKNKFNDLLTVTAAAKIPVTQDAKDVTSKKSAPLPFPIGFEVQLNV